MPNDEAPATLHDLLADLYPSKETALVKACEATGMEPQHIVTDGSADDIWNDILRRASKHSGWVQAIVDAAPVEFPARADALAAAAARFEPGQLGGSALFLLPFPRNPRFVGRDDDLARLHDLLRRGGSTGVRPVILTGLGGVGKTQMA